MADATDNTMESPVTATAAAIIWREWGGEAFDLAAKEDKLVLLDISATWCHWCHVMDQVTYEDGEVIRMIHERFVPVRIDRDRLPEVDAHFQSVPPLIPSQAAGWPLVAIITPQGHTLYKSSFLPPRANPAYGTDRGLLDVLEMVHEHWRSNRQSIQAAAQRLDEGLRQEYGRMYRHPGAVSEQLIQEVVAGLASAYDSRHGGFGAAPKFYSAPALELLAAAAWRGDERAAEMLAKTLQAISRGGVYDQIGGGFHRYSTDEQWTVPHFEKMTADNAAMLSLYANAHAATGRHDFASIASATLAWVDATLGGQERRGFYASQDADAAVGDDGDYFTWTVDEVRAAAGEKAQIVLAYYDVDPVGNVHGRIGRNVLHLPKPPQLQAKLLGTPQAELLHVVEQAKAEMATARGKRKAPPVDRTVFADLNGMMIDAYLTCYERLGIDHARQTALTALDVILEQLRDGRGVLAHCRQDGHLEGVGLLADQAWMARAAVHAYAVTAEDRYLQAAAVLADYMLKELTDEDGSLRSAPAGSLGGPILAGPRTRWEDTASRNPATVAVETMIHLAQLTGREDFSAAAAKALTSFAGGVRREWATFLAGYALAMEVHLHGPVRVVVVGPPGGQADALANLAGRRYIPGGMVLHLSTDVAEHKEMLQRLGLPAAEEPAAYVCLGRTCLAPAGSPEELDQSLNELTKH